MNWMKSNGVMTFGLCALTTLAAACDGGPQREIAEVAASNVRLELPAAVADQYDEAAAADFDRLSESLEEMNATLGLDGDPAAKIHVTYLGHGRIAEDRDARLDPDAPAPVAIELVEREGYTAWDTVSLRSGNEFRVQLPVAVVDGADARATREGINLGSEPVLEGDLAAERSLPEGQEVLQGPTEPIILDDGTVAEAGWSNGVDTRTLRGTYNVAQTHSAYRKLVDIGGCSGTMIGPKHIVTAAHCIRDYDDSRWVSSTARAGRSGNAWRDSVSFSTSNTWYWTPSSFRTISDGLEDMPYSATPYDIGVIVTHGDRMGNTVGWMGWYWWSSDASFGNRVRYNRGYPNCGNNNSPAGCLSNGLYGDTAWCAVGNYSSPDSDGINRRFRFHCDISGGHSGSSMYHYLNGSSLVVTSIVSWEHCTTCSASDDRPNTGVRITKSYSGTISWLRQTFP